MQWQLAKSIDILICVTPSVLETTSQCYISAAQRHLPCQDDPCLVFLIPRFQLRDTNECMGDRGRMGYTNKQLRNCNVTMGVFLVHAVIREMAGDIGRACYFRFSEQVSHADNKTSTATYNRL